MGMPAPPVREGGLVGGVGVGGVDYSRRKRIPTRHDGSGQGVLLPSS
jgi:hypothetical protein